MEKMFLQYDVAEIDLTAALIARNASKHQQLQVYLTEKSIKTNRKNTENSFEPIADIDHFLTTIIVELVLITF